MKNKYFFLIFEIPRKIDKYISQYEIYHACPIRNISHILNMNNSSFEFEAHFFVNCAKLYNEKHKNTLINMMRSYLLQSIAARRLSCRIPMNADVNQEDLKELYNEVLRLGATMTIEPGNYIFENAKPKLVTITANIDWVFLKDIFDGVSSNSSDAQEKN
jgi:hypothetical protein